MADQLQTNYAADLRHILKTVFDAYCSQTEDEEEEDNDEEKGAEEEEEEEEEMVEREAGDGSSDPSSGEEEIQTACACEGEIKKILNRDL